MAHHRIALNMKGVPYKTIWVDYCDIEPLSLKLDAPPSTTRAGAPLYTLPLIQDPSTGATVVDSFAIAKYLDATYPGGITLVPEGTDAFQTMFIDVLPSLLTQHLLLLHITRIAPSLNPHSEDYFRRAREMHFGNPLAEIAPVSTHEALWKQAFEGFSHVHGWLNANGECKVFFMGHKPSWADVALVSVLAWLRIYNGRESREWKELMTADEGRWARLWGAMEKYVHRDGGEALP
ncbi:hypothetical protein EWM64_g9796 [Hericium alpestre]|uniref:GST N-terminal domain-containing protein n=1 Tax=Hericium alpestre TaxID=135208 RepID=A0A4Y9ZJK3_9AGAM|nr:hypothetical protein EWM64_g9796 [Hericium alpestre]